MALERIGYALRRLNDDSPAIWKLGNFPWRVGWAAGITTFDKVKQVAPDSNNPIVMVEEVWGDKTVPFDKKFNGWFLPVWDAPNDRFVSQVNLIDLPPDVVARKTRHNAFNTDPDVENTYALLTGSNPDQVDTWLDNNVTDIVSARNVLKRVLKLLGGYL